MHNPSHATTPLLQPLFEGPLDLVGDIHGEFDALQALLRELGYDQRGRHPGGRRLVFVGDLCDRGPDSVAVIGQVAAMLEQGHAQCVLGNHELNLLRGARKEGNGWYFDVDHDRDAGKFDTSRRAGAARRPRIDRFLQSLPLALGREDLRVVHACWDSQALKQVAAADVGGPAGLYAAFEETSRKALERDGSLRRAQREKQQHRDALRDPQAAVPLLRAVAKVDEARQMANPVRVLTSGVERVTAEPFFSSGQWRMTERIAWWNEYAEDTAVVMGHYWRWPVPVDRRGFGKGGKDLFAGTRFNEALGPRGNVLCIDYSVGRRFQERQSGGPIRTRLGALRWPERTLVFDDGSQHPVTKPVSQSCTP